MIYTDTHGNGNGLNDLYIACDTYCEFEFIMRIAKHLGVTLRRFNPNPESDWFHKRCFEIPFREDLRKHFKLITRQDYMNGDNLHHAYYSQFVTEGTKREILSRIGIDRLAALDDKLNEHYGHSPGGCGSWIWDTFSFHRSLLQQCNSGGISLSDCTCVAKAAAREVLKDHGYVFKGNRWQKLDTE